MKAAIYARVSTRNNGQDPETQLLALREYAKARNLEVVEEYVDVGISGSRSSRPSLDRMLQDARRRKFKVIAVTRLDRLGRSLKQLVMTLDELRDRGVGFVSLQEAFDTTTSTGMLLFQVVGAIAEFERSLIRERVVLGLERARKQGKRLGRPTGTKANVRNIQKLKGQGLSTRAIAAQLSVSKSTVGRVLSAVP